MKGTSPKPSFIELDFEIPEDIKEFRLDTISCESQLSKKTYKVELPFLSSFMVKPEIIEEIEVNVPFFNERGRGKEINRLVKRINKVYGKIESPCSMMLETREDLRQPISVAYQVSHSNYILFKNENYSFPKCNCGPASRTIVPSIIHFGFPNASYVFSGVKEWKNHCYVAMPFVINDGNVKGSLVVDPTYDQYEDYKEAEKRTRNPVFIKIGEEWEHVFPPKHIISFDILAQEPDAMTKHTNDEKDALYHSGCSYFMNKAFSNPLKMRSYLE